LGKQILRSGTSIGSNYREAQRSRSRAEFHSKIQICRQELDETHYWFELINGAALIEPSTYLPLMAETRELMAIFTAIAKSLEQGT
jgi:four helix bundle protein